MTIAEAIATEFIALYDRSPTIRVMTPRRLARLIQLAKGKEAE